MAIDRPIFIVGPHRSGTTLLYGMLSKHPALGYLNRANHRFPGLPGFAHLLTRLGAPDDPQEAQHVWDKLWTLPDDRMDASAVTDAQRAFYPALVERVLRLRKRARFLAKYPRLSLRLGWLDALFPGCYFLHVVRDWRAVLRSTIERKVKREKRGGGWFGVRIPTWREDEALPPDASSARIFAYVTRELEAARARYPGRLLRVRYDEICADVEGQMKALCASMGLECTPSFLAGLPRDLKCADYKWRDHLKAERVAELRAADPELFGRYEF
ncbi:MAG: sulfotransferase [Planctomycetes bacterium]|nr:sulfotransferase [Planctomycetota bacterium]